MWNLRNKTDDHMKERVRKTIKETLNYIEKSEGFWRGGAEGKRTEQTPC